ncbi:uncharacterized protein LOC126843996 isoform X2 [Adelges cooleyi]|uniref:uncharacterized protein LOC126843996 isoform X2 n=1 Tax=Adelges cooleyi TaxID=133065 RepID=UPI00218062D7|nr:uncharacterized protein LOC126843996 isoform X2 [Adelges cooleyi]
MDIALNDVEAVCIAYLLNKRHKKQNKTKRQYWVHPLNVKRPQEGQFNITFMTLRAHPDKFFDYYRMSIQSFDELVLLAGQHIQKQYTNMRIPISPEERYLATGTHFSALHYEFLMGVSTITKIVRETCEVLWTILQPIEMSEPTTHDWLDIAEGYFEKTQFPNTVGAVDGKHIRIECPRNSGSLYYNYKNFFSLILMAICDSNYCFRIINVGSYGKESDCNVFKMSAFGKKLYADKVNFPPEQCLPGDNQGVPQPFVLVADEAFALNKNLLRPFPGRTLNDERRIFNYRLSRARQYIECSFGILSKKWRVFQTSMLVEPNFAVIITKACCVLHNFVRRRDGYNFKDSLDCSMDSIAEKRGVGNSQTNAKDVREYFVKYVNHSSHALSWQSKIIGK